jgi:ABC-type polysaccharide transport system permease subunit
MEPTVVNRIILTTYCIMFAMLVAFAGFGMYTAIHKSETIIQMPPAGKSTVSEN